MSMMVLTVLKGDKGDDGDTGPQGPQGPKGDKGDDGLPGKDGVGLKSTVVTYGLSTSETTQPTSWTAQVPTLTKGKYLWTKTIWTYTNNTSETGYQKTYIAKDGNDGNDGIAGKDGVGIKSTTITYASSTSGTTKPTSGWSSAIPTVSLVTSFGLRLYGRTRIIRQKLAILLRKWVKLALLETALLILLSRMVSARPKPLNQLRG